MKEHQITLSIPIANAIQKGLLTQVPILAKLGSNCSFGATGNGKRHDYDWSRAEIRNHSMLELVSLGNVKMPMLHVPFKHKKEKWERNPGDDTVDRLYPDWQVGDQLSVRTRPKQKGAPRIFLEITDVRVERLENAAKWVWVIQFKRIEETP